MFYRVKALTPTLTCSRWWRNWFDLIQYSLCTHRMAAKAASTDSTQCGVEPSQSAAADPFIKLHTMTQNWREIMAGI